MESNPCGRGEKGFPLELAEGGGHKDIVDFLNKYDQG